VACAVAGASVALFVGWGFTVDDALISTRVAHNIARGDGYRFNPSGPIADCVTPLGWAPLLAPLSVDSAWQGLVAARWLGVVWHLATAAVVGTSLSRSGVPLRWIALTSALLAICLPFGAWASSGMETALVTLLATLTVLGGRVALLGAWAASALRPEMLPWAFTLATLAPATGPVRRLGHVAVVLSGALLVAVIRAAVFGHPAPLAVFAKPSDLAHGMQYALQGFLLTGVPLLLVSVRSYKTVPRHVRTLALGCAAHFGALVVAGGDWMALFRLFVPVLPICAVVGAHLLANDARWLSGVKLSLAAVACLLLSYSKGPSARGVFDARAQLVALAEPLPEGTVVGTLDVGWVGATGAHEVVDFAGVTDREVALLPGGHTSKRLPTDLLRRRQITTLVLLLRADVTPKDVAQSDWRELPFARTVEKRVSLMDDAGEFAPVELLPLRGTAQYYLVLGRRSADLAAAGMTGRGHPPPPQRRSAARRDP
jgi:hypothetical protein